MINPYAPDALVHQPVSPPRSESQVISLFWIRHFVTFQVSFLVIWLGLICAKLGAAKTIEGVLAAPHDLLPMAAFGAGAWVPHAILALVYPKMRRIQASATAIAGSSFFLIGMLLFDLLREYLPQDASMYISWTPTYALVTLYLALSLAAVLVLVRLQFHGG